MHATLTKYASLAVPRYTSYPTAPHFRKDFPGDTYREWLGRVDPREPVSLYLHVPFCRELCWYCGCNMRLVSRYAPVSAYLETLLQELELLVAALPGRTRVSHLHFGGGTPTVLEPDDLARVMDTVHGRFDFDPDAELAIECDPRNLSEAMMKRIGALGFTRASFGVQEFDPRVQAAINRIQPPQLVRRAIDGLRGAGVRGINLDLIYGLPHQSSDTLARTIETCVAMRPNRFALFGYAHVPWMAKKQRLIDPAALPGPPERAAQAARAAEELPAHGYVPVGIDHFALPEDSLAVAAREGCLRRNFQGYTTDQAETLIGMGVTAIGRTPDGYVQNLPGAGPWTRAVQAGELPVGKGRALTLADRARAHVIERLMCDGVADTVTAGRIFDQPDNWCDDAIDSLEQPIADGLVTVEDGRVRFTASEFALVRVVAAAFDAYLERVPARHSVAI